jgi:hypothetical protein
MTRCPGCGSTEVRSVIYSYGDESARLGEPMQLRAALSDILPLDETSPNWICMACSRAWPDLGRVHACREIRGLRDPRDLDPCWSPASGGPRDRRG